MQQELEQQKQIIEMHKQMRMPSTHDPSGESNILNKQRQIRTANSQPAIAQPKTREEHPFGNRDRSRINKKIEGGTNSLYQIYENQVKQRKLDEAKGRLKNMFSRKEDKSEG